MDTFDLMLLLWLLAYIDGYGATKLFPHFEAAPNLEACGLVSMDILPLMARNLLEFYTWLSMGKWWCLPVTGAYFMAQKRWIYWGPRLPNHFPLKSTMVRDFLVGPVVHPSLPVESLASKIFKKPKKKPIIWDYTTHKNGHFGDGLWWFIPHYTDSPKHQLVRFLVHICC